jgi:hypothetical protein
LRPLDASEARAVFVLELTAQLQRGERAKCLAVGGAEFVSNTRERLGARGKGREVVGTGDLFVLREPAASYGSNFSPENQLIAQKNSYLWEDIS